MVRPRKLPPENPLLRLWRQAEPANRRNAVLGALVVGWALYLVVDMRSLRQDPRLREKLKLDDPNSPTLESEWSQRFNKLVKGEDES